MAEECNKPAEDSSEHINLKVKAQDGTEIFFRVKKNTKMKKIMSAYCAHPSVKFKYVEFLFNLHRLRGEETPEQLEMEDGDEIDAMRHVYGSGPATSQGWRLAGQPLLIL